MCAEEKKHLPLEDILILDNSWVIAGPHGTRLLSDLGATVIRIETSKRKDNIRFDFTRYGVKDAFKEAGFIFQENNRDKLGLQLNMKSQKGKEVYRKLVEKADVVVSNVTPRALRSMGIDYDTLSSINPGIISINASGLGDYGSKRDTMIFAAALNCIAGLSYTIGNEDEEGFGIAVSTADNLGGAMVAFSILAALAERDKSGRGQFIDLSEAENMMGIIGATMLEWQYNQTQTGPIGNHQYYGKQCPHNAYMCAGFDNWVAIACGSDDEWKRLACALGKEQPALLDSKYDCYEGRKADEKQLDQYINEVTVRHNNRSLAEVLQAVGVSAAPVQKACETLADEHLNARYYWRPNNLPVTDARQPDYQISAPVPKLYDRTAHEYKPAPALGQDNEYILKQLLGLSDDEIDEAAKDGAFI